MVDVHIMSSFVKWEIVTFMGLFISSLAQSIIVAGSFFFFFFFIIFWRIELFSFLFLFQNLVTKTNLDNAAKRPPAPPQPPVFPH